MIAVVRDEPISRLITDAMEQRVAITNSVREKDRSLEPVSV